MGRPQRDGLLYFSFDTDFFYADKQIKRVKARLGNNGLLFYIYLLTEIYRNGYCTVWDKESEEDAIDTLNLTEGFIKQAMICLNGKGLITTIRIKTATPRQKESDDRPQCEFADDGNGHKAVDVITSPGIQKRYQEAVKGLKRDIMVDPEIWLLNESETAPHIKFTLKNSKSEKNQSKSEKNQSKSEKNDINEMKRNEMKEIKDMCKSSDLHRAFFESIWKLYPVKKGKGQVSDTQKKKLFKIGYEEMARAIERYKQYVESVDYLRYQNGSTFFNSGYVDYLDANYVPAARKTKSGFGMTRTDYDFEELERKLAQATGLEG